MTIEEKLAKAIQALDEAQYELFTVGCAAPIMLDGAKWIQWANAYHAKIASDKFSKILEELRA